MACQDSLTLTCDYDMQLFAWFWGPYFTMDSVRGVRIHCACEAIMKCTKLNASKLPFFFFFVALAACSRHPVFYNGF